MPEFVLEPDPVPEPRCPDEKIDPKPLASIARRWNEQILNAIRRDIPRPTVHARNLFHLSAAMWDAWAAYDDVADGYFVRERQTADDAALARDEAISSGAWLGGVSVGTLAGGTLQPKNITMLRLYNARVEAG